LYESVCHEDKNVFLTLTFYCKRKNKKKLYDIHVEYTPTLHSSARSDSDGGVLSFKKYSLQTYKRVGDICTKFLFTETISLNPTLSRSQREIFNQANERTTTRGFGILHRMKSSGGKARRFCFSEFWVCLLSFCPPSCPIQCTRRFSTKKSPASEGHIAAETWGISDVCRNDSPPPPASQVASLLASTVRRGLSLAYSHGGQHPEGKH